MQHFSSSLVVCKGELSHHLDDFSFDVAERAEGQEGPSDLGLPDLVFKSLLGS